MENTFFDKESFDNDIALEVNSDVLNRIYGDGIKPSDKLNIEFYFITDTLSKVEIFKDQLQISYPEYEDIKVKSYEDGFEITGITAPVQMSLTSINEWNTIMWEFGYKYDCKLDGWQVEV